MRPFPLWLQNDVSCTFGFYNSPELSAITTCDSPIQPSAWLTQRNYTEVMNCFPIMLAEEHTIKGIVCTYQLAFAQKCHWETTKFTMGREETLCHLDFTSQTAVLVEVRQDLPFLF